MKQGFSARSIRKIVRGVQRIERQPYDFLGATRTPRLAGSGPTIFFANHLVMLAATGTWPSITPSQTTGDVYFIQGGVLTLAKASATIYNFLPDATTSTRRQILGSNNDGTYTLMGQSCSAG